MDLGLSGRSAAITGGSMGIGKAVAASLAGEGVNVAILARGQEAIDAAVAELDNLPGDVVGWSMDLTDRKSVDAAAAAVAERFGTIHILVNNAGHRMRRMDRQILWEDEDWEADIDIKTLGTLRAIRAFHPHLARDGTGRIINISGVAASIVFHGALTHGINNAAMQMTTKYLAKDMAAEKITVNTISPGVVATEWRQGWAQMMADNQDITQEEFLVRYTAQIGAFVGRWAEPREIADIATFLASDRAAYITGTVINVDGGITANAR